MHSINLWGRRLVERLPVRVYAVHFDGLRISGGMENRYHLYHIAASQMEPFMSALFQAAVKPGMVVLDIGAHLGYYTLLAAKAGATVYAFEPDPRNFQHLIRNIALNGDVRCVTAVPRAVSDKSGTARLRVSDNPRNSNLFDSDGTRTAVVEQVCLDEFLDETVTVDVVKMDIEGAELRALTGMERTLARARSSLTLFVECSHQRLLAAGGSAEALIDRLTELGFTVASIDEQHRLLTPIPANIESLPYVNLYCTRGPITALGG
ncbi:MAG: FkbM family methyltransferase [bacterium]